MHGGSASERKSDNERKEILAVEVANLVSQGHRVEVQSEFYAILTRRKEPNHLVHLFLTLFTGVWLFV